MNLYLMEGFWLQFKGRMKERVGIITDNPFRQIEGRREQRSGKDLVNFGVGGDGNANENQKP